MAIPAPVNLLQFNYALPFLHIAHLPLASITAQRQVRYFRDDDNNDAMLMVMMILFRLQCAMMVVHKFAIILLRPLEANSQVVEYR